MVALNYTPLYGKAQKKTKNAPMETTLSIVFVVCNKFGRQFPKVKRDENRKRLKLPNKKRLVMLTFQFR